MNGLKHGKHVRGNRVQLVLDVLACYPPRARQVLGSELYAAGLLPVGRRISDGDVRRFLAYLARRWFDCASSGQSDAIKPNQMDLITAVLRDAWMYDHEQDRAESARTPLRSPRA